MTGRIPQDVIDQVLAAHDVAEVVGRYVTLARAGRSFKALCPFHEEKTPSFHASPDRQSWHCFGCGKGGNVFGFLMEHDGLTFPEAVRALAAERGIRVPDRRSGGPEEEGRVEPVRRALSFAAEWFQKALASEAGAEARAYLARRGYDAAACRRFALGYAPAGWAGLVEAAAAHRLPGRLMEEAGLALPRREGGHYDRFRHRVTFPVRDLQGRVITFGARALAPEDQPKYLNGPETVVFKKNACLFALELAREGIRRSGEALLMEGYTDVLMCHLHGIDRAVAGMGTAFTPRQAGLLRRFADRVVLVYDGDPAGRTAAERALDVLLPEGLEVRTVLLPEGRDVDEILLEEGPAAVESLLAGSLDVVAFKLRVLGARLDLTTPRGRAQAGEALAATILKVPSPLERDQLLQIVAERLALHASPRPGGGSTEDGGGLEGALRREAARIHAAQEQRAGVRRAGPQPLRERGRTPAGGGGGHAEMAARVLARTRRDAEDCLLAAVLSFPALRPSVLRAVDSEDFADPVRRRLYKAVLDLDDLGTPYDPRAVARHLAEDQEAQAVLAGLPDDSTLEERVPSQIEFLERQRRAARRSEEIAEDLLAGGTEVAPGPERRSESSG